MYLPAKYKMAAQLLLSNEKLDFSLEECAEKYKPQEEFLNNTRLEGLQFPLISKF